MTPNSPSVRPTLARAIAIGTAIVGTLDLADAIVFFGVRGVAPIRICQSIAAGVLGRAAFNGGVPAALLGVVLHFTIACLIVSTFVLASRRIPALTRAPIAIGVLYGIAVYFVMNLVVVPLSAAGGGRIAWPPAWPVLLNGLMIHMFGVGLPASLVARRAQGS